MAGILINTDALTFFHTDKMNAEGVREDIDFYTAHGGVEAILFNMNFQRCLWRSHSREALWDGIEESPDGQFSYRGQILEDYEPKPAMLTLVRNAKRLSENCPELFELRYRYCHERGVGMWHSVRMNDVHWTSQPDLPQHSALWRDRPDLWRCHYRLPYTNCWENMGLDYLQPEVRDFQMALIREYLEHECDGIEFDWLRSLPIVHPGMEEPAVEILTGFVRDIHDEVVCAEQRFGHRIRIAVRVPRGPLETLRAGLDVCTWAGEGLVDTVIPSPPLCQNNATHMPLDLWRRLLPPETILAPSIDCMTYAFPGGPHLFVNPETDSGFAASFYHRGADTIYLYNHFRWNNIGEIDLGKMQETFGYLGNRDTVNAKARRHITTYYDSNYHIEGTRTIIDLPLVAKPQFVESFPVDIGGATSGRTARLVVGANRPFQAEMRLDGVLCPPLPDDTPMPAPMILYEEELYCRSFEIPHGAIHDGRNTVDIINLGKEDFRPLWVEVFLEKA